VKGSSFRICKGLIVTDVHTSVKLVSGFQPESSIPISKEDRVGSIYVVFVLNISKKEFSNTPSVGINPGGFEILNQKYLKSF